YRCPVDQVSYEECRRTLARLGLMLPSEAQWEYAARGGTSTPWWTGDDSARLKEAANLADRSFGNAYVSVKSVEDWDDGFSVSAPVGTFKANGFGLPDPVGNVWEWCRDHFGSYRDEIAPGDGERIVPGDARRRVIRGGSFYVLAVSARSANRDLATPESISVD